MMAAVSLHRFLTLALVAVSLWAVPLSSSAALRCSSWGRVPAQGKEEAIRDETRSRLDAPKNAKYQVNRPALARCMERWVRPMREDFDYACAQGTRVPMDVLDTIYRDYFSRCLP